MLHKLLNKYDKVLTLKIFVSNNDNELKGLYHDITKKHNEKAFNNISHIDAGFDLYLPNTMTFHGPNEGDLNPVNKVDFGICCSAQIITDSNKIYNSGYYLHPRSSLSKTQLRLANSTGIVDAGYRGNIIGMFDVVNTRPHEVAVYFGKKHDRYLQICAPGLIPILVEIVNSKEELGEDTERGDGGFGSTGR